MGASHTSGQKPKLLLGLLSHAFVLSSQISKVVVVLDFVVNLIDHEVELIRQIGEVIVVLNDLSLIVHKVALSQGIVEVEAIFMLDNLGLIGVLGLVLSRHLNLRLLSLRPITRMIRALALASPGTLGQPQRLLPIGGALANPQAVLAAAPKQLGTLCDVLICHRALAVPGTRLHVVRLFVCQPKARLSERSVGLTFLTCPARFLSWRKGGTKVAVRNTERTMLLFFFASLSTVGQLAQ
ncbi:hypothetical protein FN846DRAFT_894031 [Sphaerosporella brunnea]|uniref:Secreted protein n=1 Tax=Sphaerosporella brunnea TaxID=1250544 RepID=A0A5J5EKG5_9PEZI|nr:hypothetical protein FN846DRAFT_894031 [Sphaerosporella brunnea]